MRLSLSGFDGDGVVQEKQLPILEVVRDVVADFQFLAGTGHDAHGGEAQFGHAHDEVVQPRGNPARYIGIGALEQEADVVHLAHVSDSRVFVQKS